MRALARLGQRAMALAPFDRCRLILAQELGVAPEAETVALFERIRPGAESPPIVPHLRSRKPPAIKRSGNLPSPTNSLVGRAREVADLVDVLSAAEPRLLSLNSAAGCGKTRLALVVADTARPRFPEGVFFVVSGPFSAAEAQRICGLPMHHQLREDLNVLADFHLVRPVVGHEDSYVMRTLARAFACEQLVYSGEDLETRRRYGSYVQDVLPGEARHVTEREVGSSTGS